MGHPHGARPRRGARRQAFGGRAFAYGARFGSAQRSNIVQPTCGPTTRRDKHRGRVLCRPSGMPDRGLGRADRWRHRIALGTWNVTSPAGKEQELVREVEQYQLDIVGLISTHSSGTKLREKGWTLFFSVVAQGERCRAGVGILTSPRLSAAVFEFSPEIERATSVRLQVAGCKALAVVCAYAPNRSSDKLRLSKSSLVARCRGWMRSVLRC